LRDGLPLLPAAPLLVVIVGVAVAIAVTLVGLADLRRTSDDASSLRARVIANTLAARLRVTGSEDRMEVVQGAARRTYADILPRPLREVVADASLRRDPSSCAASPAAASPARRLEERALPCNRWGLLEWLSVIAMVPAPLTPTEAGSGRRCHADRAARRRGGHGRLRLRQRRAQRRHLRAPPHRRNGRR
jgi:hypothetical protein